MKLSYAWLKELVPDLTQSPQELANLLTLHSFETVVVKTFALDPHIQVVRIETIEPHPNADRLRLATVTNGQETIRVVCGAPNIEAGQVVPYSAPGTKVLDKDGQVFELTIAKIRGVESPGMLNSRRELGLGADRDGIYVLPSITPLGSKLAEHMPTDTILEADITPNRAHDCLSHLGVAREIAAITGLKVKEPNKTKLPEAKKEIEEYTITVSDPHLTPRYMNVVMKDLTNSVSPLWIQARLMMLEQKPISALVDITNYVMLEVGNPTHAFDAQKLPGKTMGVRLANPGEEIPLLDGTTGKPTPETLVITSQDTPVALAGVIGGKQTEVDSQTADVLLEIANFHPYTIQKTALALGLRTEAAARFLKGIDPNLVEDAAGRLIQLLGEITGGNVVGVLDNYPHPRLVSPITFRPRQVAKVAGIEIQTEQARQALKRLRCQVEETGETWLVTPPSDRLDITAEHELVEEVIFQTGLHTISANPVIAHNPQPLTHAMIVREAIRNKLMEYGFTEIYNYSFSAAPEFTQAMNSPGDIQIANPVTPKADTLRSSLLPGLLANVVKNKAEMLRKNTDLERSIFEIGHVYKRGEGRYVPGVVETLKVAGMSIFPVGKKLVKIKEFLNINDKLAQEKGINVDYEHMSVRIKTPKIRAPLYYFEINLDELVTIVPRTPFSSRILEEIKNEETPVQYEAVNRYPSIYRDISILVDPMTSIEQVKEVIERTGGELVVDTDLFDEYSPDEDSTAKVTAKKSLSFHIEYSAPDRTLTDEEVVTIQGNIEKALQEEVSAEIR